LDGSEKVIISGDFNNSVIWDKGNKDSNFRNTNAVLESMGFKSSYHKLNNEDFGQEECATLFHTKKRDKTYHIDYVFLKGLNPKKIEIGSYDDWIKLSDHVPVIVEI
jgi:endonuclease/exonuclease/phosphatase family metal-dependent hydrolase